MLTIQFDTDNAAFGDEPEWETARLLREVATRLETSNDYEGPIRDANGNTVGTYRFEP